MPVVVGRRLHRAVEPPRVGPQRLRRAGLHLQHPQQVVHAVDDRGYERRVTPAVLADLDQHRWLPVRDGLTVERSTGVDLRLRLHRVLDDVPETEREANLARDFVLRRRERPSIDAGERLEPLGAVAAVQFDVQVANAGSPRW